MKTAFAFKKLGEVCEIDKSQGIHKQLPYVGLEHIESNTARFLGSVEPQVVKSSTFRFGAEHLLYGRLRPYLNKVLAPDFEGHCSTEIFPLKPNPQLCREYLLYWFLANETVARINATCTGARMPRADMSEVLEFDFPLPSLSEQHRIVAILDEAFDGIATAKANAEKNLQNARSLFESQVESACAEAVSRWGVRPLESLCSFFVDSAHRTPKYQESGIPALRPRDVVNGKLDFSKVACVSEEEYEIQAKRHKPSPGDIVYSRELSLGWATLLPKDPRVCLSQGMCLFRLSDACDNAFMLYVLNGPMGRGQALKAAVGAAHPHINLGDIKSYSIPLPPLAAQRKIAGRLDALLIQTQRLESLYQRKLAALDELKQSLLHQAFSGELTKNIKTSVAVPAAASNVIPFPAKIPGISTTDLHAGILAIAYELHEQNDRQRFFGHVKAEKVSHMVEVLAGIDLDRQPVRDAAGPNDYRHLKLMESRARKAGYFSFERVHNGAHRINKLAKFDALLSETRRALGDRCADVDLVLQLMLPMDTQQAEILATVHAAWNNLLLDGKPVTDEAIVRAAREDWHPDKLNIDRERFFAAIGWIREKDIAPRGVGRKVGAKLKRT